VHLDWPTYGIPLVEYESILRLLRNNDSTRAADRLEAFLDEAIRDASQRRPLLRGKHLESLDAALVRVAQYRAWHPRELSSTDASWAQRQREVDAFLEVFRSR